MAKRAAVKLPGAGPCAVVQISLPRLDPARTPLNHQSTNLRSPMRMLLNLAEALPSLVEAKFTAAKASSSLLFSPTELAIIRTSSGIPVGTRLSGHMIICIADNASSNCDTVHRLQKSQFQSWTRTRPRHTLILLTTPLPTSTLSTSPLKIQATCWFSTNSP